MFELFRIKIKMLKIKIVNLFIFPVKWHFLYLQMVDFITHMLLKYFNDDHTKKKGGQYLLYFCIQLWEGRVNIHSCACEYAAYVEVRAHKRMKAFSIER